MLYLRLPAGPGTSDVMELVLEGGRLQVRGHDALVDFVEAKREAEADEAQGGAKTVEGKGERESENVESTGVIYADKVTEVHEKDDRCGVSPSTSTSSSTEDTVKAGMSRSNSPPAPESKRIVKKGKGRKGKGKGKSAACMRDRDKKID